MKLQKNLLKDEIGDFALNSELCKYFVSFFDKNDTKSHEKLLLSAQITYSPKIFFESLQIEFNEKIWTYPDVYLNDNLMYHTIPLVLLYNNKDVYDFLKNITDKSYNSYILDSDFTKHLYKDEIFELNRIQNILMGTGYTFATLPSDGTYSKKLVKIDLENNDSLICSTFIWYNK